MKPSDIVKYLDDFRMIHAASQRTPSRLISLKVAEPLLNAFKAKAALKGARYQSQIKKLMEAWLDAP